VAVRTNDVALGDLFEQSLPVLQHRARARQVEGLLGRVAMVEVHLIWLKGSAAIVARNAAQLA
jgi:hypothetical protein